MLISVKWLVVLMYAIFDNCDKKAFFQIKCWKTVIQFVYLCVYFPNVYQIKLLYLLKNYTFGE